MDENFNFSYSDFLKLEINYLQNNKLELFDNSIDEIFNELKINLIDAKIETQKANVKLGDIFNFEDDNSKNKISKQQLKSLYDFDICSQKEDWILSHLNSLAEMKIIYLFKNIEINMKMIIQTAYPEVITKNLFNWENLKNFLLTKKIELYKIEGYKEVNDLRKLNNTFKHSNLIHDEIRKIKEFSAEEEINFDCVEKFYNRVKPFVEVYMKNFSKEIIKDLFHFDDERIELISKDYKDRMTKKT